MKSIIKILIVTIVLLILATLFFSMIKSKSNYTAVAIIENNEHLGKKLMETHCYACHNPTTSHENRLAPPMVAVKKHYKSVNTSKEEFVSALKKWVEAPSEKLSKMPGAVRKFGIMPYAPYKAEDIELIADYIFDNDIEQPEWFQEHYQQEHGKGMGKGKNKN
ncbi:cytochrome c [Pontimicrobium aquaticum]|uniref:Cytochrome c n=1 Tax=Pontimicrobium aquaticum TaxID=2565367 RepID=A0A4U0EVN1_9FLAO|nr:cytochrome c [Pontimicrobium aquaticum]TJY35913.1 cytochrome c [Pontimicrobium aquaticum]